MKAAELIFIPLAGMGHLVSAVELAKRIAERDERISITILVMKFRFAEIESYIHSLQTDGLVDKCIEFLVLPELGISIDSISKDFIVKFIDATSPLLQNRPGTGHKST
ncbi:hypothetical protein Nepgr_025804 [Nepenthes gracilis]|uniref:Uncharacterized protein n=1 Tax=Nepenthes gracilis TaxID=150966 RepID=A0AAD3T8J4_NEPGR|nr:hypothetical protein Nepgr_025804 [Nepenthes gracilis]